jgi:AcrR family transcriptional regulator
MTPRRSRADAAKSRPFHRGLTRDTVLATALRVLDADGRDALTMRRLATELDVEAASLYTHVRSKDDLVDGVLDVVLDAVPLPKPDQPWRVALADGFRGYRAALLAHPVVVPLITERGRTSAAQLRLVERSIELLESAGLPIEKAVEAHLTLVAYTIGFVAQEAGRSPSMPPDVIESSATLQRVIPALLARTPDERFDAGLERILDGVTPAGARR